MAAASRRPFNTSLHFGPTSSSFRRRKPARLGWRPTSAAIRSCFSPQKELKYFSCFFRSLDLVGIWTISRRGTGGQGRGVALLRHIAGATNPVDSPPHAGRETHFPDAHPVSRAWSHAKHNHRYGEANFVSWPTELESATDDQWRPNFATRLALRQRRLPRTTAAVAFCLSA